MKKILNALLLSVGFTAIAIQLVHAVPIAAEKAAAAKLQRPVAGKDYIVLKSQQTVNVPAGKIEVIEFMSYDCPHCNELDPRIEKWKKAAQAADVVFERMPVTLHPDLEPHSRMLFALEALGPNKEKKPAAANSASVQTSTALEDALTPLIFKEIHVNGNYLPKPQDQANFLMKETSRLAKEGVKGVTVLDKKTYLDAYNSFGVIAKVKRADNMAKSYNIEGVPVFIVQGQYMTGPAMTRSLDGTVEVLNYLVQKVRDEKKSSKK